MRNAVLIRASVKPQQLLCSKVLAYEVATGTACLTMGALTRGALTTAGAAAIRPPPQAPWPQAPCPQGDAIAGPTRPGAADATAKKAQRTN
ncbi:hypothetical protein KGM_204867 [Danaus plexippus plexippus]|uniref:Uncharacterized protein n=1 Tax=Danaus plexippus plexippus TaxID=278856 RepID=A0A212FGD5_DANPL|nr:hypothetical protein KGM_204867 [Danaus plexippus plexippus]